MAAADRHAALAPRMPEVMALPPRQRRALYFSTFFAQAAAPMMRMDLTPVFDQFRPDVVIHEAAELAAGPMAVARSIPHVTVAFSGALADSVESLVIDSISPVWFAEGLPVPTIDDIRGDLYLHPFPASFGQAPTSRAMRSMRAESFDGTPGESPRWLDDVGSARPLVYLTSGTEPRCRPPPTTSPRSKPSPPPEPYVGMTFDRSCARIQRSRAEALGSAGMRPRWTTLRCVARQRHRCVVSCRTGSSR